MCVDAVAGGRDTVEQSGGRATQRQPARRITPVTPEPRRCVMAKTGAPGEEFNFSKMMDFSKLAAEFKLPGVDMQSVMDSQRRNLEVLGTANKRAIEGMQAVARRQSEIFRQMMEETQAAMRDFMAAASPEDKAARQTELVKTAFERAIANMREISDLVAQSNN